MPFELRTAGRRYYRAGTSLGALSASLSSMISNALLLVLLGLGVRFGACRENCISDVFLGFFLLLSSLFILLCCMVRQDTLFLSLSRQKHQTSFVVARNDALIQVLLC